MQNLQDVYAKWEAKAQPRLSGPPSHGQQQERPHNRAKGRKFHHDPAAFKPNKHGVDKIYVPKSRSKKPKNVALPYKNSLPPMLYTHEKLGKFILDHCLKCLPYGPPEGFRDRHNASVCLENALQLPSSCRNRLTPVEFLKSIYLKFRGPEHQYKPISKDILQSQR